MPGHAPKAFHRQYVNPSLRTLPTGAYGAAADIKDTLIAYSLLETIYTAPAATVRGGVCSWVGPAAMKAVAREPAAKLAEAEMLLSDARAVANEIHALAGAEAGS